MKKMVLALVVAVILALNVPVMAQPTVGVFFDEDGTQVSGTFNGQEQFDAYVMAHWLEGVVGGASYALELPTGLMLTGTDYPAGAHVGEPDDGCGVELGLSQPIGGFWGNAILLTTLHLFSPITLNGSICVIPHCHYQQVKVADANATLWDAVGQCAFVDIPVATDESTWGAVKSMYR